MNEPHHNIPIPTCNAKANPNQALQLDNLDSRREFSRLLDYLPPLQRVAYLHWVCQQTLLPGSNIHPAVSPSTWIMAERARHDDERSDRLTLDVVIDVFHMCGNYHIDLDKCLAHLERLVKQHGKRPG
jgi:hypothetical protein